MCGSSAQPRIRSGPAPVLADTAVCWRMSSQPTKSTLTSTPNSLANLAVLARKITSSGSTKRAGRSMRSDAPFSTGHFGAATSDFGIAWPVADRAIARAAAIAPNAIASRRRMMNTILRFLLLKLLQTLPRLLVEQMDQCRVGPHRQDLAGSRCHALAEGADHRLAADAHQHLRLRAGRLDHLHGRRNTLRIEPQMLGPHAVDRGTFLRLRSVDRQRPFGAVVHAQRAGGHRALHHVHGRR